MVVSGEARATDAGLAVLKSGGNAIDAAVAMGFVLGVTHSGMTGLGGGGYILVRMADGRTSFLDFREQAPGGASRDMFLDAKGNLSKDSVIGWKAAESRPRLLPDHARANRPSHDDEGHTFARPWRCAGRPGTVAARRPGPVVERSPKGATGRSGSISLGT